DSQALAELDNERQRLAARQRDARQALGDELELLGYAWPSDPAAWLAARERDAQDWQQAQAQQQTLRDALRQQEQRLDNATTLAQRWRERWQAAEQPRFEAPTGDVELLLASAEQHLEDAERHLLQLAGERRTHDDNRERPAGRLADCQARWSDALQASPFSDEAAFLAACLPLAERQALQARKQQLDTALTEAVTLHQSARQTLEQLLAQPLTEQDAATLAAQLEA